MPQLSDFRVNQVVRCISRDAPLIEDFWRVGDLGVVTEINQMTFPLKIRAVRRGVSHVSIEQMLPCFEPVIIKPDSKVRIVGFGPECWTTKWRNPRLFADEIGTVGRTATGSVTSVVACLAPSRLPRVDFFDHSNDESFWGFATRSKIPELIPYQSDEDFDVDFWRDLWFSYPRFEMPEPDLPEPKKTKYDADY